MKNNFSTLFFLLIIFVFSLLGKTQAAVFENSKALILENRGEDREEEVDGVFPIEGDTEDEEEEENEFDESVFGGGNFNNLSIVYCFYTIKNLGSKYSNTGLPHLTEPLYILFSSLKLDC